MALNVIVGELKRELDADIATATYWELPRAAEAFASILEWQQNVLHAGEAETAMLLCLRPDLVDRGAMASVAVPTEDLDSENGVYRWRPMTDFTDSGVIGVPSVATAEKGERLLEAAAEALAGAVTNGEVWPAR